MHPSVIKTISTVAPGMVVSFAYKMLTNPQVKKLRDHETKILSQAIQEDFPFKNFSIKLYQWGQGTKKILLIHGWEGQAGNFADLIEKLLQEDYTIYAFDGPSHGYSSSGKTNMFDFTELVGLLIKKFEVKLLVSHSFGGVATSFALYDNQDIQIDKYLMLTTPDRFTERIDDVAASIGITNKVKALLIKKLETATGRDVGHLNVSDFVKSINVESAMIIHDKDDKVIPISRSRNVHANWSAAEFLEVSGTGHFRILRDASVINSVLDFLNS
ncbi:MAG: alpha/beta hydrolase [Cytophagales bacterium]|nr:alpha/beta hydrolase [Cytophagales bacterium]